MTKKVLTVISVLTCFAWGTLVWFTGDLILARDLTLLGVLKNGIYLVPLAAPFIRSRLQFNAGQLLIGLSALSSLGLIGMMIGDNALTAGYFAVGVLRIFLMPVLLGFAERNLGATLAVVVLAGGFHLMNAVLKPGAAWLVENNLWRYGLGVAILLLAVSAVTARLALTPGETDEPAVITKSPNPELLGKAVIAFIGIQVLYGLREIAVFPLATEVLGSSTSAGILEGIAEGAMLVGVFLTPLLKPALITPMLCAQALSALVTVAAIKLHNPHLLYAARIVEGLSYAVLERIGEVIYVGVLGGLPTDGVAYQWIDSISRVVTVPGRMAASAPLDVIFWVIAAFALVTLALASSGAAVWTGDRLYSIAGLKYRLRLVTPKQLKAQLERLRSSRIR
jgi:hypothetical protein